MEYKELLDLWDEKIFEKVDNITTTLESMDEKDYYSYRHGRLEGYQEGLLMATSILSRLEQLHPEVKK